MEYDDKVQWWRAQYWDTGCTFNPYIGCSPDEWTSPACAHCYAHDISDRFNMTEQFRPTPKPHVRMPHSGVCFCGNMTDLFGDWVATQDIRMWLGKMWRQNREHDFIRDADGNRIMHGKAAYLWLTKRAERLAEVLGDDTCAELAKGAYFGVTAENQEWYDRRVAFLRGLAERKRRFGFRTWLSAEPLLGELDLGENPPFDWVAVGCESGPNRRPCPIERIEGVVRQCVDAGIPVFVKQLDLGGNCERDLGKFPEHLRIRQIPWFGQVEKKGR